MSNETPDLFDDADVADTATATSCRPASADFCRRRGAARSTATPSAPISPTR